MACIVKRRGRWVIDFYDQYGKRRWKTLEEGTTKKEARQELRAIEESVDKGMYIPSRKIPLFSKVAEDWIKYKKPKIRITTWNVMKGHIENHFSDFDGLKINQVSMAVVEAYITKRQNDGMNINTLRKILVTLGQILNYAVRHRYIDHNPLRDAERPKRQGNVSVDQENIRILSPEQINAFLSNVEKAVKKKSNWMVDQKKKNQIDKFKEQKYKTLFMLAVFSGGRQGELLGLQWKDFDWKNSQIHIQRTFNNGRFFDTKTRTSNRKIDIGPKVMTELKKWKLACPQNDLNLVFPNGSGEPIDHHNLINRYFIPTLDAAELPKIRFHDLRHTYASLLIEQGENIKYIQNQLGHSNPTVTLNVYAHLMKSTNQEAACRLENAVLGGDGSKMVAKQKKGIANENATP